MATKRKTFLSYLNSIALAIMLVNILFLSVADGQKIKELKDEAAREEKAHTIDSVELLVYMGLLILTVLSIWVIKHFRLRFIHETGLSIIYGVIIGALVRYLSNDFGAEETTYVLKVNETQELKENVIFNLERLDNNETLKEYTCHQSPTTVLGSQMVFDPEIFFYVLLPPIIFHAGYSMKRRHFFRNFGAIITYAFIGTILSTFTIGGILYGFARTLPSVMPNSILPVFKFQDCLWYGSIISATDPVTVLAIFHDLNVDVDLYALVFGESVLNDAVAITLASAIEAYGGEAADANNEIDVGQIFLTIGNFLLIFIGSFLIGLAIGCVNALLTKFTKIRDFPLLESSLLMLMSYSSYLVAEACGASGIVAVLFCGIFQAHYTFNNLSEESKKSTKEVVEMLNFITENFVFLYIGVTVFTRRFSSTDWNPWFIFGAFIAMIVSRLVNIYPLSFFLNLGRKNKISYSFQHMMMFSGLRGAIAFALAIRNAASGTQKANIFLTTTVILVMLTVIGCGALTLFMLQWLKIRVGVDDPTESQNFSAAIQPQANYDSTVNSTGDGVAPHGSGVAGQSITIAERARMVKVWNRVDNALFKPILTNYRVTLADTFPDNRCCGVFSKLCTTPEQFHNSARHTTGEEDDNSDIDMIIDSDELTLNSPADGNTPKVFSVDDEEDPGDLGVGSSSKVETPMLAFM